MVIEILYGDGDIQTVLVLNPSEQDIWSNQQLDYMDTNNMVQSIWTHEDWEDDTGLWRCGQDGDNKILKWRFIYEKL